MTMKFCLFVLLMLSGSVSSAARKWNTINEKVFGMKIDNYEPSSISREQVMSSDDKTEFWSYVNVRPKAHMFWWLYQTTHSSGYKDRPLILWLQGGPGGSGTGFGNFGEFGPLDINLKPRSTTWLQTASLLFIDNPVGTGYSYVEDSSAYTKNVAEISADLLTCMQAFVKEQPDFQSVPFYIFSESYGGKMTAAFSDVLYKAIEAKDIKLNFKGFAMGDSWISPTDSVDSWAPYLLFTSIVSMTGYKAIGDEAAKVRELCDQGKWEEATSAWSATENIVEEYGSGVNFYNIMKWGGDSQIKKLVKAAPNSIKKLIARHVMPMQNDDLNTLMNGPIRKKLKIIPDDVTWGGQSGDVFQYQSGDFMKNVTSTVNSLINNSNLTVVVYSGQLDLICDVIGSETWFGQLDIAKEFYTIKKETHPCGSSDPVCYFSKQLKNVQFYWILNAGHMVPADNGPGALSMVNDIIGRGN